jgi:hypothetical protein
VVGRAVMLQYFIAVSLILIWMSVLFCIKLLILYHIVYEDE